MAKTASQKNIIQEIKITQAKRNQVDISNWRNAIKTAESVASPRRYPLIDLYNDLLLDAHISAVWNKRKSALLNMPIVLSDNGKENEQANSWLHTPAFTAMLSMMIDTILWGHTLLEIGNNKGNLECKLIPRRHVLPVAGLVLLDITNTTGLYYRDPVYQNTILELSYEDTLGLMAKAAPHIIYKRNCLADYSQYTELFGQPIREGIYDGYDENARMKLKQDMEGMGSSQVYIHPQGTEIKFVEATNKSQSAEVYLQLISGCNTEISKLILGNTETTESSSSSGHAQAKVHQTAEQGLFKADRQYLLNILNYQLKPLLIANDFGIKPTELFFFKEAKEVDLKERIDIDTKLAQLIPVSAQYFYETYGISKPENGQDTARQQTEPKPNGTDKKLAQTFLSFFGFSR